MIRRIVSGCLSGLPIFLVIILFHHSHHLHSRFVRLLFIPSPVWTFSLSSTWNISFTESGGKCSVGLLSIFFRDVKSCNRWPNILCCPSSQRDVILWRLSLGLWQLHEKWTSHWSLYMERALAALAWRGFSMFVFFRGLFWLTISY